MKTIFKKTLLGKITDIKIFEDSIIFNIGDDIVKISDYHAQDCCETVFCDFSEFEPYIKQINDIDAMFLEIKGIEDEGIMICFSDNPLHKVFLGCHDDQNGYYSNDLELIISINSEITKIDISEFELESFGKF